MDGFKGFFWLGEPASKLIDALDALQSMLPAEGGYAVGSKWCIADMAVAPFLVRVEMLMKHDLGVYAAGEGKKALEILNGGKFVRYNRYVEDLKAQPAFKATWDEVSIFTVFMVGCTVSHYLRACRLPRLPSGAATLLSNTTSRLTGYLLPTVGIA